MNFERMSLRCYCGLAPAAVDAVGFAHTHYLVVQWQCQACKRLIYVLKDLRELTGSCEDRPDCEAREEEIRSPAEGQADSLFLRSVGILA